MIGSLLYRMRATSNMEEVILISWLNDFIFCPVSIYFHNLYGNLDKTIYQSEKQLNGSYVHKIIDSAKYSSSSSILQGVDVYSTSLNIKGKIDVFNKETGILTERKKKIVTIYDGYVFQVYAQCYALEDMGYNVSKIRLHSIDDNKTYNIPLPKDDIKIRDKFISLVGAMHKFDINNFVQTNIKKCENCIYEPLCDRSLVC